MAEPNGAEQNIDIDVNDLRGQLSITVARMKTMAASDTPIDPRQLCTELAENVLPVMADVATLVDRLEEHAAWATTALTDLMDEAESRLLPDDADRFRAFITVVTEVAKNSLTGLDPTSDTAQGFRKLIEEGESLSTLIDDIELDDGPDDGPQGDGDDDDDDDDDEPDDGDDDEQGRSVS